MILCPSKEKFWRENLWTSLKRLFTSLGKSFQVCTLFKENTTIYITNDLGSEQLNISYISIIQSKYYICSTTDN